MTGRDEDWTGIQRHGLGWRALVSQGRGRSALARHFPRDTPVSEMQAWRKDAQAERRLTRAARATGGTFAQDAQRYLRSISALPTLDDRRREIALWTAAFGSKRRERIRPADIRQVRDRWMLEARSADDPRPVAPGTINKRLRALSNLYTVLDGRHAPNPVREVPEIREPEPEARALTYDQIAQVIAAMPDIDRATKGKDRQPVSVTKIRVRCLAYCQITPRQLGALTPADLDLEHGRLRLPARMKGRGAKAIWTELVPAAVAAFTDFDAQGAYGPFSQSSLRKSFKSAVRRAGIAATGARPYDLRHAFGAMAYRATHNLSAVGKLMQHTIAKTTERYALAAEAQVLAEVGAQVSAHFVDRHGGSTSPGRTRKQAEKQGHGSTGRKTSARPVARGTSRKRR